jgi:hypothetical protein
MTRHPKAINHKASFPGYSKAIRTSFGQAIWPVLAAVALTAIFVHYPTRASLASFEIAPQVSDLNGPGKATDKGGQNFQFFRFGDSYGYITLDGNLAIEPTFGAAKNFEDFGLAPAADGNNKWGLIEDKGNWVVQPALDEVRFDKLDKDVYLWGRVQAWWGKLSLSGKWLMKPRFHDFSSLGHTYYSVRYQGRTALTDENGAFLTKLEYENFGPFHLQPDGRYMAAAKQNGRWGIIDQSGQIVISPRFEYINPDFDERGFLIVTTKEKQGVLSIEDRWILKPIFAEIEFDKDVNLFFANESNIIEAAKYYYLNGKLKGRTPIERAYKQAADNPAGFMTCKRVGNRTTLGYCSPKGKFLSPYNFQENFSFNESLMASVKINGKWGYLDSSLALAIPAIYDDVYSFDVSGWATVKLNGQWGLIDKAGNWLIKPTMDESISSADNKKGLFWAKYQGKYGLIDKTQKWIYPPKLDEHHYFGDNNYAWASQNGLWGLMDTKGAWFLEPKYDSIGDKYPNKLQEVAYKGKYAMVDNLGALIAWNEEACGKNAVRNSKNILIWPKDLPVGCK